MSQPDATQAANSTPSTTAAAPPPPPVAAPVQPAAPATVAPAQQPPASPLLTPAAPPSSAGMSWEQILASMRAATQPPPAQPVAQPQAPAQVAPPAAEKPADKPDVAALQAQLQGALIRSRVEAVATSLDAINAADVLTLMGDAFQVDAAGNVMVRGQPGVSVKDAVAAFLNTRPHLMKPQVPAGGSGATVTPPAAPAAPAAPDPSTPEGATAIARGFLAEIFSPPAAPSARPST